MMCSYKYVQCLVSCQLVIHVNVERDIILFSFAMDLALIKFPFFFNIVSQYTVRL